MYKKVRKNKMLDMEKFNYNYHNVGDYDMLMVIKDYLYNSNIDNINEYRLEYLKELLNSVIGFNECVVDNEMYGVAKISLYNMYVDLKNILFFEMGIYYDVNNDLFIWKSESE